jgi:hypothetical protein
MSARIHEQGNLIHRILIFESAILLRKAFVFLLPVYNAAKPGAWMFALQMPSLEIRKQELLKSTNINVSDAKCA